MLRQIITFNNSDRKLTAEYFDKNHKATMKTIFPITCKRQTRHMNEIALILSLSKYTKVVLWFLDICNAVLTNNLVRMLVQEIDQV